MKRSIRQRLARGLALIAMTAGMTLVAFAPAQAARRQTIVNRGDCLSTRSWTWAEQVVTRTCNGSLYQQWDFTLVLGDGGPDSYYKISNAYNDMCLDVAWAETRDWTKVVQAGCTGTDNQLWKKEQAWNLSTFLRPRHTNKCLDISWGWAIQYECNSSVNQQFWGIN